MTFREEDMYPYVRRNLRARYPKHDGWEIYKKPKWPGYEPDFVVERKKRGRVQRVIVEVKLTCKVSNSHVSQLNKYVRNLSGKNAKIIKKILVVPAGADTTYIVSDDIEVMYLRSFGCADDEILWYG